jgi:outer membrane immunogenic protein
VRRIAALTLALLITAAPVSAEDWSGAHVGFHFGGLRGEADGGSRGTGGIAGAHLGYDMNFGTFVLGAEVDVDFGKVDLGGSATLDSVARLKLRAGADLGRAFVYGTAGVARAETSIGSGDGGFAGVGAGWRVGERMTVGGELLHQRFDDLGGSGRDAEATSATARVTFSF